jgi:hypothetical protein
MHTPGLNHSYPVLLHQMLCHGYPRGTIAGSRISLSSFLAAACVTMATGNHAAAQTVTLDLPAMSLPLHAIVGTGRQQEWLDASINERAKLAEAIGEEGAREYAKSKGWTPVQDGNGRSMIHGPDQVYRGPDGTVHVVEAKGGSGQLGKGYGYPQGSSEWAVESARRVLRNPSATEAERTAAMAVLEAAAKGNLEVHVVRTTHVLGEPAATVLEQTTKCSDEASRLAQTALGNIARPAAQAADDAATAGDDVAKAADDIAHSADDVARAAGEGSTWLKTTGRVLVAVGVGVDGGMRVWDGYKTEQAYADGHIDEEDREIAHSRNAAGMAGGWAGATALGEAGAVGGGAVGTMVCPGIGTVIGSAVGGLGGGIAGYFGGEWIGANAAEWAVDGLHSSGFTIKDAWTSVWGD